MFKIRLTALMLAVFLAAAGRSIVRSAGGAECHRRLESDTSI